MVSTLRRRALNRATLDRQLLLRRAELPLLDGIELIGSEAVQLLDFAAAGETHDIRFS